MISSKSSATRAFAIVITSACLATNDALGQDDMASMPGMTPARKSAETNSKKAATPKLARAAELLAQRILEQHLNSLPSPVEDNKIHSFVLAEILEYRANSEGPDTFRWDVFGWIGSDYNRLWIKTEGSQQLAGRERGEGYDGEERCYKVTSS